MTTPEILRRGADEVRKNWIRGIRHNSDGAVCAVGALENAIAGRSITMRESCLSFSAERQCHEAVEALARLLPRKPNPIWTITFWNNAFEQTSENVAATMELAAICFEQAQAQPASTNAVDPGVQPQESGTRA